ncbi:Choline/ethanolamine kinase [Alkaliphilus metalliredigens QYMF]|uniref:Choline/ethanolamine kinase n=1 Tax=Alkaliphilus metalliredigens (strain QYMF) TaxID=293826 RepID=A6TUU0_ALKMQ|nr:choline/ethanolamine kinase family protein [Alkaliphilus metalliredigens]ABR49958.1 Choline/ethanolamine kinase [Alkaliphilus metalliredigens QYMF]
MSIEAVVEKKLQTYFQDDSIEFDKSRFAGGLTNYNYIMQIKGTEYVIRQPGGMTNKMIDRKVEKENNRIASQMGINSECVYFDEESGTKFSKYIPNSENIANLNPNSPQNIEAVSEIMRKIHQSKYTFSNEFDFKSELDKYESLVEELNGSFFFDYLEHKEQLFEYMENHLTEMNFLPCHNDTVPENFIMDKDGVAYLVDWEYSGMNDPNWDIAAYILESRLTQEGVENLYKSYYQRVPNDKELGNIKCYILAQDLLWTVWALIRHYNGDDFLQYCYMRYERFKKNIREMNNEAEYPIATMADYN